MYYNSCPFCGANLDPNEKCDCREEAARITPKKHKAIVIIPGENSHALQLEYLQQA